MGREPCARLVFMPAIALVLADPVPHRAVSQASVGHCGYRSHKLSGGREEGGGSLFMTAG